MRNDLKGFFESDLTTPTKNHWVEASSKKKTAPAWAWPKKSAASLAIQLKIENPAPVFKTNNAITCCKNKPTMMVGLELNTSMNNAVITGKKPTRALDFGVSTWATTQIERWRDQRLRWPCQSIWFPGEAWSQKLIQIRCQLDIASQLQAEWDSSKSTMGVGQRESRRLRLVLSRHCLGWNGTR